MENPLYRFNHKVKTSLKKALWPGSTLFEDMGFTYLGPSTATTWTGWSTCWPGPGSSSARWWST